MFSKGLKYLLELLDKVVARIMGKSKLIGKIEFRYFGKKTRFSKIYLTPFRGLNFTPQTQPVPKTVELWRCMKCGELRDDLQGHVLYHLRSDRE